jgi:peptide/nickel transport system permease protein
MTIKYLGKRLLIFFITVLVAATINFFVPRLTPQDPIAALIGKMASKGMLLSDSQSVVEMYEQKFGMDKPLIVQYFRYLGNVLFRFDFGYSLSYYPSEVLPIILNALPWTLGLLAIANLLAFVIGNLLGALCVWGKTPKLVRGAVYFLMPFSTIPYYILALLLMYLLAILNPIFPISGATTVGAVGGLSWAAFVDIAKHAALPIFSVALSLIGFWALSMRGIMATVMGEDYLTYANARGLRLSRIFSRYAVRNAILPQITAFAIDVGKIISGAVLVEIIFNYPGIGYVLYNALRTADYFVIQGVIMFIILSVALTTLIIDLVYPKLDPRIRYE